MEILDHFGIGSFPNYGTDVGKFWVNKNKLFKNGNKELGIREFKFR